MLYFILGLIVGSGLGIFITALCVASRDDEQK